MAMALGVWIGQRVNAVGNPRRVGTVRYVGAVEGYAGDWVGVDWDDGEGKHDGSLGDVRYFSARGERSGSFIRAKNLSSGISFLEALHLRYGSDSTKEEEGKNHFARFFFFFFLALFNVQPRTESRTFKRRTEQHACRNATRVSATMAIDWLCSQHVDNYKQLYISFLNPSDT